MRSDTMELNRKTAMELWKKQFGKTDSAIDYAGREILKAAYDDRGSTYCWNVDHILPKSRGGKTAEHNLICCHMETNSEKADRFPCFTANDTRFEIRRVQNHYEIVALGDAPIDFFDAEAGVEFWDKCYKSEEMFGEGYVTICFNVCSDEVDRTFVSFIRKLFEGERISLDSAQKRQFASIYPRSTPRRGLLLRIHGLNRTKDIQRVLGLCVLLNTYMDGFLYAKGLIDHYSLYYDIKGYKSELEAICTPYDGKDFGSGGLFISESVRINTDLKEKQLQPNGDLFSGNDYAYNYFYTNLKAELENIQ